MLLQATQSIDVKIIMIFHITYRCYACAWIYTYCILNLWNFFQLWKIIWKNLDSNDYYKREQKQNLLSSANDWIMENTELLPSL